MFNSLTGLFFFYKILKNERGNKMKKYVVDRIKRLEGGRMAELYLK